VLPGGVVYPGGVMSPSGNITPSIIMRSLCPLYCDSHKFPSARTVNNNLPPAVTATTSPIISTGMTLSIAGPVQYNTPPHAKRLPPVLIAVD
jgi:hypothetical protein